MSVELIVPQAYYVHGYRYALERGWSLSTVTDNRLKMLELLDKGGEAHLADLAVLVRGTQDAPFYYRYWWVWDGEFCGVVVLMHRHGTSVLPDDRIDHVGYNIVPWKQGRGLAPEGLRLMLPEAKDLGLDVLRIAPLADNRPSCRVAEKVGATLLETRIFPQYPGQVRSLYELTL